MKKRDLQFSRFLTYLLHPLIIPALTVSALLMRPDLYPVVLPAPLKIWFVFVVFVFTLLIPSASVFVLQKLNAVNSIELTQRSERTIPLVIACTSYLAFFFFIKSPNIPPVLLYVLYTATFALIAGLIINMVYKVSLHTLGWGALTATLVSISLRMGIQLLAFISVAILLAGLVGYARLKENAHNQTQVYLGYIAGAGSVILVMFLF
jgi:hypothetical protein